MRRPSVFSHRSSFDVKMTPMIDVVFLLLVFFVWTASFQAIEYLLPSQVRQQQAQGMDAAAEPLPPEADFEQVVVRVRWINGRLSWSVNDREVASLTLLSQRLRQIAEIKQDAPVILHPDPQVPLGHVIDVYDVSRLAGFPQVQFAVDDV